ncbi:MAG: SOS response-associated peptidase [Gammaproteobacteria bacterium]|nr:SOS response-associated peptidase [Gammaproteobacteria bacterium]
MCGRYFLHNEKLPVAELFADGWAWESTDFPANGRYNLAPSQHLPVALRLDGRNVIQSRAWGLAPAWLKDSSKAQINARGETAHEKPMFRKAVKSSRCLVPATGWYEWRMLDGRKQPYALAAADRDPVMFAGIEENDTFAIITTEAIPALVHVHHRMPRVLSAAEQNAWLQGSVEDAVEILAGKPRGAFAAWPVDRRVNSPRNDDPACIQPVELDED